MQMDGQLGDGVLKNGELNQQLSCAVVEVGEMERGKDERC